MKLRPTAYPDRGAEFFTCKTLSQGIIDPHLNAKMKGITMGTHRTRYTPEQKREMLARVEALRKTGLSQAKAIEQVGMNKASYHAWSTKKIRKSYTKKKIISMPLTENLGESVAVEKPFTLTMTHPQVQKLLHMVLS